MSPVNRSSRHGRYLVSFAAIAACLATVAAISASPDVPDTPDEKAQQEQILRGRNLVLNHGCGDCHGGMPNPESPLYLTGFSADWPFGEFTIEEFKTRARNLTPDNTTGLGRFSERQIFNALRFGLRPGETPDVEITSSTPGEGNFPMNPKYLAPPMPWPAFRHMSDQELWDIAAYLKRGLKPVSNQVPDSEGPPDFWAGMYVPENIGTWPAAAYPTEREGGN